MPKRARYTIPDYPHDRPSVTDLVPAIEELYRHYGAGGLAHAVTDDGNLGTSAIQGCIDYCLDDPYHWNPDHLNRVLSYRVLNLMLHMTMTQRRKALAKANY